MRKEVIAHNDPKSPVSEVFRTLRTNIQFMNTNKKMQTILVTSTLPGEGKSWVSSNLAVTFAQAGKSVILVDADMRKGRQYTIFGVSPRPGLSNYLSGVGMDENEDSSEAIEDYIQETEVENLYLIAAGNIPPNPSELLISPQMVDLIERLKEICDIIIFDGTPSELVTDALILTRLVDSTVIVTESNETKKEILKRVVTNIQNVGGKIAGIIVNKMPVSSKKYQQAYYYGSTSSMGNGRRTTRRTTLSKTSKPNRTNTKPISNRQKNLEMIKDRVKPVVNIPEEHKDVFNSNIENDKIEEVPKIQVGDQVIDMDERQKELHRNIKVENSEDISIEKTKDILNQINSYLDTEKKKLK